MMTQGSGPPEQAPALVVGCRSPLVASTAAGRSTMIPGNPIDDDLIAGVTKPIALDTGDVRKMLPWR
jgi:hypothetical protein